MLKDHGKTALIHGGREISYAELIEHAGSFARLADVLPDERVLIVSENRPEWVYSLFGIWQRGAVAVPVDFMSEAEEIAYVIEDSEPVLVFCSKQTFGNVRKAVELSGGNIEVVNYDTLTLPRPHGRAISRSREDLALILYTSGTTGKPKGVMLTFGNLLSNIEGVSETGIARREDSTLAILPFHHSYPLMVTLLLPLHLGATVVFLDRLTPEDILEKLRTYRISILVGVPRLYNLFHRRIMERIEKNPLTRGLFAVMRRIPSPSLRRRVFAKVHSVFGGNVKFMVSGGAKLDLKVAEDLTALGFTVLEGYGLTETSPIVTFNPPDRIKLGSVGLPVKDVSVRISQEGEVLVRGPNVMKGYWRRERETAEAIKHGWFHTGDLGYVDEEGYLYITGRKKEIIVLGTGKNVNPEEIESLILQESELVKEAGVLEVEGKLHALVYPDLEKAKEMGVVNLQETLKWEVIDRVNRKLPEWKRIAGFRLTGQELPKTRLGKLKRFLLPELYRSAGEQRLEGKDTLLETEEGRLIREYLQKETGRSVYSSSHLELDLGLDSLGKIEFLSFLEKTFGVSMSEEDLSTYGTVGEVVNFVRSRRNKLTAGEISWREILEEALPYEPPDYPLLFFLGRTLLKIFFSLYNRARIEGVENFPEEPFIIAPNHTSYLDGFVLAAVLPDRIAGKTYFLGEETYFRNPITSLFAKLAHIITVNINRRLKESLQKTARLLKSGKVVVIFPEGARTRTGELMEFKKGVAILSRELKVPVVPVALVGTYESMPPGSWFPKPVKIRVKVGKPLFPEDRSYEEITEELRKRVEELLKSSCR